VSAWPNPDDVIGPYVVRALLGVTPQGRVYRADSLLPHAGHRREASLAVLDPACLNDAAARARFFAEARALAGLKNENLVEILDILDEGDQPAFAVELLRGHALSDVLKKEGRLPLARSLHIAWQMSSGLAAAHDVGLMHRRLSPLSVFLVDRRGLRQMVKLVDFSSSAVDPRSHGGAALQSAGTAERDIELARLRAAYLAPEQHRGPGDHRVDIYSFGVILFELVTGRLPFIATSPEALRTAHEAAPPPPPGAFAEMPSTLEALILACLQKDPDDRPGMMREVQASLREVAVLVEAFQPPAALAETTGDFAVPGATGWTIVPGQLTRPAPITGIHEAPVIAGTPLDAEEPDDLPFADPEDPKTVVDAQRLAPKRDESELPTVQGRPAAPKDASELPTIQALNPAAKGQKPGPAFEAPTEQTKNPFRGESQPPTAVARPAAPGPTLAAALELSSLEASFGASFATAPPPPTQVVPPPTEEYAAPPLSELSLELVLDEVLEPEPASLPASAPASSEAPPTMQELTLQAPLPATVLTPARPIEHAPSSVGFGVGELSDQQPLPDLQLNDPWPPPSVLEFAEEPPRRSAARLGLGAAFLFVAAASAVYFLFPGEVELEPLEPPVALAPPGEAAASPADEAPPASAAAPPEAAPAEAAPPGGAPAENAAPSEAAPPEAAPSEAAPPEAAPPDAAGPALAQAAVPTEPASEKPSPPETLPDEEPVAEAPPTEEPPAEGAPAAKAPAQVAMRLESKPPGAQVVVEDEVLGVTPFTAKLVKPGGEARTVLVFRKDGYEPYTRPVALVKGARVVVTLVKQAPAKRPSKPVGKPAPPRPRPKAPPPAQDDDEKPPTSESLKDGALVNPFKR
jgi:hypothetical protein